MKYKCKILDLIIEVEANYELLKKRLEKYIFETDEDAIFCVTYNKEEFNQYHLTHQEFTLDSIEYMLTGKDFFSKVLKYQSIYLHASAISIDNKAYLFSAPSGTGKSTHTSLYLKTFNNSFLINDDKPVIRIINDSFYVYGSPWSGKHDLSKNIGVPLGGICFLRQGKVNKIEKLSSLETLKSIISETLLPQDKDSYNSFHDIVNKLLNKYQGFIADVDISEEAVMMTYNELKSKGIK